MANKFSKLCIDETKLEDWIVLWCEDNLDNFTEIECINAKERIKYTIRCGTDIIKIDFIKCSGGLFTIQPNGKFIDVSTAIAESIYSRVSNVLKDSPFSNGFSIIMELDDFEAIIDLLNGMDGVVQNVFSTQLEPGKARYYLYKFTGELGDTITVKYYLSTKRMQIQGRPLKLFNEVVSLISEQGADLRDVVDAQLRYCNVEISNADIQDEMMSVLGTNLYGFLSNAHKSILATAFVFSKIEISMPDYSPMVQQALRAFEGFFKKVLNQKGIECIGTTQVGKFFSKLDGDAKYSMLGSYVGLLKNPNDEKELTAMYNFYYKYRHPYSHATAYDFDTRIIESRRVADELFSEIIESMKSWYDLLM